MRRTTYRALLLTAALCGFAALPAVAAQRGAPPQFGEQPGLRDCGTALHEGYGTGWCSGTGSFRLRVTCSDGHAHYSARATVRNAYAQVSVACPNSGSAVRADIVPGDQQ